MVSQRKYRAAAHLCWERTRNSKAQLELTLATNNKNGFFKCVNSKKRPRENFGLLFGVNGHFISKQEKKTKTVNIVFCLTIQL